MYWESVADDILNKDILYKDVTKVNDQGHSRIQVKYMLPLKDPINFSVNILNYKYGETHLNQTSIVETKYPATFRVF